MQFDALPSLFLKIRQGYCLVNTDEAVKSIFIQLDHMNYSFTHLFH